MDQAFATAALHVPRNKGRLVGQKLPLRLKEIWAIRIRLQLAKRARELALFDLAIDRKLLRKRQRRRLTIIGVMVHDKDAAAPASLSAWWATPRADSASRRRSSSPAAMRCAFAPPGTSSKVHARPSWPIVRARRSSLGWARRESSARSSPTPSGWQASRGRR